MNKREISAGYVMVPVEPTEAMLKLEKVGLTHSNGLRIRPKINKEFGLKPRDSYDKFIEAVQAAIDKHIEEKGLSNGSICCGY